MKHRDHIACKAAFTLATWLALALSAPLAVYAEDAIPYSSDPAVSAEQREVYDVVHRYESALNAKDTDTIVGLFAEGSVAEWNNKRTYATRDQKIAGYNALFRSAT